MRNALDCIREPRSVNRAESNPTLSGSNASPPCLNYRHLYWNFMFLFVDCVRDARGPQGRIDPNRNERSVSAVVHRHLNTVRAALRDETLQLVREKTNAWLGPSSPSPVLPEFARLNSSARPRDSTIRRQEPETTLQYRRSGSTEPARG